MRITLYIISVTFLFVPNGDYENNSEVDTIVRPLNGAH